MTESSDLTQPGIQADTAPTRVLAVYYSQSGDVSRAMESFIAPIKAAGAECIVEAIRPTASYPFPWKNLLRFFNLMPECVVGESPPIEEPTFSPDADYDLVILGYSVWFLSPALPIRGFFNSPHARVLDGRRVITVSVSRNMWHSAGETMKRLLGDAGAKHIDNAVITHQGPVWATFITTTRMLFFGKRDRFLGIFPPAGIRDEDFNAFGRFGDAVANQLDRLSESEASPLLGGLNAAPINRRFVLPEFFGGYIFSAWARIIRWLGGFAQWLRIPGVLCFIGFLVSGIVVGIPLLLIGRFLFHPLLKRHIQARIEMLQQPSGP